MKKLFIAFVAVGFAFAIYLIVVCTTVFNNAKNTPLTPKQLADNKEYQTYSKNVGQPFVIDSLQIIINRFTYKLQEDTTILYIKVAVQNTKAYEQWLPGNWFVLQNDRKAAFYATKINWHLGSLENKTIYLTYILPKMERSLLSYSLWLQSNKIPTERAIIAVGKSYRSGG
ncbi:MAG: hypothetical protein H7101_10570 [Deinococcales bacterium]|nr:hypothetical protein [Chitinophagaceae bacterium]